VIKYYNIKIYLFNFLKKDVYLNNRYKFKKKERLDIHLYNTLYIYLKYSKIENLLITKEKKY